MTNEQQKRSKVGDRVRCTQTGVQFEVFRINAAGFPRYVRTDGMYSDRGGIHMPAWKLEPVEVKP